MPIEVLLIILIVILVFVALMPNKSSISDEMDLYYTILELKQQRPIVSKPIAPIITKVDIDNLPSLNDYIKRYLTDDTYERQSYSKRKRKLR